jgi:hypothetical protein
MEKNLSKAELQTLVIILQQQIEQLKDLPSDESIEPAEMNDPQAGLNLPDSSRHKSDMVVIPLYLRRCLDCGADLQDVTQEVQESNQILDTLPVEVIALEIQRYGCTCPKCGQRQLAGYPDGLEPERIFGKRLEALVAWLSPETKDRSWK